MDPQTACLSPQKQEITDQDEVSCLSSDSSLSENKLIG